MVGVFLHLDLCTCLYLVGLYNPFAFAGFWFNISVFRWLIRVGIVILASVLTLNSHPATRRLGDVVTMFLWNTSQNETPNDMWMERCQGVLVVRLHDVLLERHDNASRGRNDNVPSERFHEVLNKSQMNHSTTCQWYVTKTSQWYVSTTSH